jgi:uncharacterized membrane protein
MTMEALKAITKQEIAELKAAVAKAEKLTSGEIRVFIEDHSEDGPLDRAAFLFTHLAMHKTDLRNGVLIYVAFIDRKFAIIGDKGIHEKVGDGFWDHIKVNMATHFREGKILKGLLVAVEESGEALSKYFPYQGTDRNELSDEIMFGDQKK